MSLVLSTPAVSSELTILLPVLKVELDPHLIVDGWAMHLVMQTHRSLATFDGGGSVVPDIASSFEVSNDQKSFTVKLRPLLFSDGTPLRAKHVVNSFRRLFQIGAAITSELSMIEGGVELLAKKEPRHFGVKELTPDMVRFTLVRANAIFKVILATPDCSILPIDDPRDKPTGRVGLGPYAVTEVSEKHVSLKLRDGSSRPRAPRELRYILGQKSAPAQIAPNTVLDAYDVSAAQAEALKGQGWHIAVTDATRERFLQVNPQKLNHNVRQVIASVIDTSALVKELGHPNLRAAYGLIPYGLPGARLTSQRARLPRKLSIPLNLKVSYPETWKDGDRLAEILSKQLLAANVKLVADKVSFEKWMEQKKTFEYDLLINMRGIDYPDAMSILSYFRGGIEGNALRINDPAIDKILDAAFQEFDLKKRIALYHQIEDRIAESAQVIPLMFGASTSGLWPKVASRVPAHPLGFHFFRLDEVEMAD